MVAARATKSLQKFVPTALVAFGVTYFAADAGIMVTAGHHPAQHNGYQVYEHNGALITAPWEQGITDAIIENQEPWEGAWNATRDANSRPITYLVLGTYVSRLRSCFRSLQPIPPADHFTGPVSCPASLSAVYTALHGHAFNFVAEIASQVTRVTLFTCEPQETAHVDFPTVKSPNPEEKDNLDVAIKYADAIKQSLVIANDPDAGRFAAAQKLPGGRWHDFTGDQMGVLLASYLLDRVRLDRVADAAVSNGPPAKSDRRKIATLATAASSGMLSRMAHAHDVHFEETLTGSKWLGERAKDMASDYNVIFAYEESLGYMFPSISYEKDGLAAAMMFLNAVEYWQSANHIPGRMTPYQKLQFLYQTYGYFETINTHFISPNLDFTNDFFNAVRMSSELKKRKIGCLTILRWRDVTDGIEEPMAPSPDSFANTLPAHPAGQMLTFRLHLGQKEGEGHELLDGLVTVTLRASGTRPRVKLCVECCSKAETVAQDLAGNALMVVVKAWIMNRGNRMRLQGNLVESSSGIKYAVYSHVVPNESIVSGDRDQEQDQRTSSLHRGRVRLAENSG